ncbi:MAG: efflux RND transporter periplasmic adaptor subunit [Deltaproteobacteria bacterium]|nr:efflux RND transporter periplasmic adaptor subunit [Deltaproteobacteria bacterium]
MRSALVVAAVIAVAIAAAACGGKKDETLIAASGHVEATDVRISSKVGGKLKELPLKEGDVVAPGQVVARIDTVDLRLSLGATLAERDQAKADLALRLAGERKEDIAQAEARVAAAEADLDGKQKELGRRQGLLDTGSGTVKSRDDALAQRDVAAKTLEGEKERLRRLKAGFRKEEIDAARARLAAAEARIAQIRQQMEDATVTSPLAGFVTGKVAEQGELISAGTPLLVVTDLADAWLTIYIAEPDLGRIRVGQEVEVVTDAGQKRKGKVTYVSPKAEFTPKNVQTRDERVKLVYKVKVGLENGDGLFKPGMPAEARIPAKG